MTIMIDRIKIHKISNLYRNIEAKKIIIIKNMMLLKWIIWNHIRLIKNNKKKMKGKEEGGKIGPN